jgi:hypothetical protein
MGCAAVIAYAQRGHNIKDASCVTSLKPSDWLPGSVDPGRTCTTSERQCCQWVGMIEYCKRRLWGDEGSVWR